jgi:hypothetical protein
MIDTLAGGSWSSIAVPVPAGGKADSGFTRFGRVACASLNDICVVPGLYRDSNGESRGMVVVGKGH